MSVPLPSTLADTLPPRAVRLLLLSLAAVWLAVAGGDWAMRFYWFRWHQSLILRPRPSGAFDGPAAPNQVIKVPARRGGDLTRLIGIPEAARPFEEERPATTDYTDEFGFRNLPPTTGRVYDVVMAGDSFMVQGDHVAGTPANCLGARLGRPVYTYAHPGGGPLFSVACFHHEQRFRERPPRVLVWGLVERELGGDIFGALPWYIEHGPYVPGPSRVTLNVRALHPRQLKAALPNTSMIALLARRGWNVARFRLLGRLSPDVAPSTQPLGGRPVLFYTPAVRAMQWTRAERKAGQMVEVIAAFAETCRSRGIDLVLLLIPDKEQVYREFLPPGLLPAGRTFPPSTLLDLERGLAERGLPVVNLLGPYRQAAAQGQLLYAADDTHWNGAGIDLAAAELARVVAARFDTIPASGDSNTP